MGIKNIELALTEFDAFACVLLPKVLNEHDIRATRKLAAITNERERLMEKFKPEKLDLENNE